MRLLSIIRLPLYLDLLGCTQTQNISPTLLRWSCNKLRPTVFSHTLFPLSRTGWIPKRSEHHSSCNVPCSFWCERIQWIYDQVLKDTWSNSALWVSMTNKAFVLRNSFTQPSCQHWPQKRNTFLLMLLIPDLFLIFDCFNFQLLSNSSAH